MTISIRVALAQIDTVVGDVEGNADRALGALRRARERGAAVALLPELTLPGYPAEDLLLERSFIRANREALDRFAAGVSGITAFVGFVDAEGEHLYNAAALVRERRIETIYRKHRLPNYGVFDEARYFKPGAALAIVEVAGVPIGLTICEDIWVGDGPAKALAAAGARAIVNLSASPYARGKPLERERLFSALARSCGLEILVTNLVGGQDELVFDGHSLHVGAGGEILARARGFEEDLVVTELGGVDGAHPVHEHLEGTAETYAALCLGTRDYVRKNGFSRVVIGLSGGLDSALTATVAVDALGAAAVVGVYMPSGFSSEASGEDARELAEGLGIELIEIPIGASYKSYLAALAERFGTRPFGVTEENLQSRIRGTLLMALSNEFGWLVLTTGNKSETAVGYSTLYGDTAGGFAVLRDLYKTSVLAHARHRNERESVIPERILTKPPSAELRPDQKDEDSLPPYEVLDPILEAYVERDRSVTEIVAEGHDRATVEEVVGLVDRAEYKRRQSPPGIKITPRAFGKDRRLPITSAWRAGRRG